MLHAACNRRNWVRRHFLAKIVHSGVFGCAVKILTVNSAFRYTCETDLGECTTKTVVRLAASNAVTENTFVMRPLRDIQHPTRMLR